LALKPAATLRLLLETEATGAQILDFSVFRRATGRLIPDKKTQCNCHYQSQLHHDFLSGNKATP